MLNKVGPIQTHRLWLRMACLTLLPCMGCMVLTSMYSQIARSGSPIPGFMAAICIEWGINWAGRSQMGIWWEASHHQVVRPQLPPGSSLQIHCAILPWAPYFPTRGTFIYVE